MSLFDGTIITIFAELGPSPLANESPLDESIAIKLSIAGMTILTMGYGGDGIFEKRHFRLHGPLPVPDSAEYEALAMSFKVEALETDDDRVKEYGRECTAFLIFSTGKRTEVLKYHNAIERGLKEVIQSYTKETELRDSDVVSKISTKLEEITAQKVPSSLESQSDTQLDLGLLEEKTLTLYTIDDQGEPVELTKGQNINSLEVLIFANVITKTIFKIIMKDNLSQRKLFLAGKAASHLNLKKFRSQCNIRDVSDSMMRNFLIDKIEILIKEYGLTT